MPNHADENSLRDLDSAIGNITLLFSLPRHRILIASYSIYPNLCCRALNLSVHKIQ